MTIICLMKIKQKQFNKLTKYRNITHKTQPIK
jgi:hypothetical protein